MRFTAVTALASTALLSAADAQNPLETPPEFWHKSKARLDELEKLNEGDISASTGRILTHSGRPSARIADVEQWSKAPLPTRIYDYHNHHLNSDKWDFVYEPRDDDIVIATAYKSGTTWMQTIVANLVFGAGKIPGWDDEELKTGVMDMTPWLDMRLPPPVAVTPMLAAQTHRRFLKTHLPLDGIPFNPKIKYIMISRDLRDVSYSWFNHWVKAESAASGSLWGFLNALPGKQGPDILGPPEGFTQRDTFLDMIDDSSDGKKMSLWSYWHHFATWWQYRSLDNIMLVHYSNLKSDPKGQIAAIAKFLEIEVTDSELDAVVEATSFDVMKKNGDKIMGPMFNAMFDQGDGTVGASHFIHKGTNGRWKDELTAEDNAAYEAYGPTRVSKDGFEFLKHGMRTDKQHAEL